MNMATVFDIGANDGESTLGHALAGHTVWAFEPHPYFCEVILSKTAGLPNHRLFRAAVSDFDGWSDFYIYESEDCSSLMPVREGYEREWTHLRPGSMNLLHSLRVEVVTLERVIRENRIRRVDWLHCDAQGNDLKVLAGLGDMVRLVAGGVVECVARPDLALYEGQCSLGEVEAWLSGAGFRVDSVAVNDPRQHGGPANELNVYFSNPAFGADPSAVVTS